MVRRKITEPMEGAAEGLPDLSENEQAFVQLLAHGASNASEAYREAFPNSQTWQPSSVWVQASVLKSSLKVRLWLNAINDQKLAAAVFTKEAHLMRLEELGMIAQEAGNHGAAVQAEQLRGKVQGYYVERHEDVTQRDLDPMKELDRLEQEYGTQAALRAAKDAEIDWQPQAASVH